PEERCAEQREDQCRQATEALNPAHVDAGVVLHRGASYLGCPPHHALPVIRGPGSEGFTPPPEHDVGSSLAMFELLRRRQRRWHRNSPLADWPQARPCVFEGAEGAGRPPSF